jgi:DNA polymerase III subunit delta'
VDRVLTRGQPGAVAALGAMVRTGLPHALLLVGPSGSGKTTLALDLAASLLCTAADGELRPCRECRGCRMVASGNHPDLHRLAPEGAGGQIVIGGRTSPQRGVRDLAADLSLLPVEGGARVAIVERAHRMNEDAQSALLKTLEEPPLGVVIVLCAEDDDRLMPTIRSRAARLRLGPVATREIEAFLADRGVADPPTASRLARLASGRPGIALAFALAPEAVAARAELARTLLDLAAAGPTRRLGAIRELIPRALDAVRALDAPAATTAPQGRRPARGRRPTTVDPGPDPAADGASEPEEPGAVAAVRIPASERRRAATFVLEVWRDLNRDLLMAAIGELGTVHDPGLLDELTAVAPLLPEAGLRAFLGRLARAGELIEANVAPELVLDNLVLAWPRRAAAA